ncbi:MAG: Rieske (2Fe-2S) protein [Beijerinckiaceae bacterium]|nr:Rieske (2Fe-2S) protein [Beijerinckiaceae bacterium]
MAKLKANDRAVIRQDGRQILPLHNGKDIFACANRCPHEGYPLSEGSLQGSVLTCNWHNWKFDLATGATLMGGGKLPFFRTKLEAGQILVQRFQRLNHIKRRFRVCRTKYAQRAVG